ncbi:MAG: hypothetical protein HC841_00295 [Verrucomicrobiae bacterium]|nr:hypothetical protein [Verrucomicrobiae bacterium]
MRTLLLAQSGITSLLGSSPGVFVSRVAQGAVLPAIRIYGINEKGMQGLSDAFAQTWQGDLDIDCYGNDEDESAEVGEAVNAYLDSVLNVTVNGRLIQSCHVVSRQEESLATFGGSDRDVQVVTLTFQITHTGD